MTAVVRNSTEGKVDYTLTRDGPMYERWARHLTKAVPRTGKRNWLKARTRRDRDRFRESALRHFEQWLAGETDEDHAAAVLFNINGYEYTEALLQRRRRPPEPSVKEKGEATGLPLAAA